MGTGEIEIKRARGIEVTERARTHVAARLSSEKPSSDSGLRIAVQGGGCTGLMCDVGFDSTREHDRVLNLPGFRLLVDPKSFIYVFGMTLDYNETGLPKGLVLLSPSTTNACGCGTLAPSTQVSKTAKPTQS